jgi:hypothetical protein
VLRSRRASEIPIVENELEDQMRKWPYAFIALFSAGILLAAVDSGSAQQQQQPQRRNNQLFTSAEVSLACQNYVNTLWPATTGQSDRQREAVMRACLRRKGL